MFLQYIPNLNKWWPQKKVLIGQICGLVDVLFPEKKEGGTIWQGLSFLYEEMNQLDEGKKDQDVAEKNFLLSMVFLLEDKELEALALALSNIQKMDEKKFLDSYRELEMKVLLISSALLYFDGEESYSIDKFANDLEDDKEIHWSSAIRFFGQSFFGNDAEVRDWADDFLLSNPKFDRSLRDSFVEFLFIIILLHIILKDFYYQNFDNKKAILKKYLWNGLCFGLDLENRIKEYLIDEPFLDFYLQSSGMLAEAILQNEEVIFYNELPEVTIGQFINKYLNFNKNNQMDGYQQLNFVEAQVKENKWPAELNEKLIKILYLYLHLRECDLIDYRGILGEAGVGGITMDWKKVLTGEINEDGKLKIKDFLKMYNRPFSTRVEIIVTLKSFSWQEEPYLSKALVLSNIYEEVFGPIWPVLLYFSEKDNGWKLNEVGPPDLA